ncbi:dihydrodipicolinate synthase family protein [Starkeya koreensis]|uniref:Dihydrodipicolinate synthase family protein n=1 Tax=Ancylobacter koreensis TaxID=266121 RepID=A0ABT0DPF6_9HYPH|nr:dihydrodipicolinate synthase family protein [Ancylobacter koreensis]MCK0209168.1 dihydrodipicolinate synthase family protein [Ancylobacter koreensis]
MFSGILTTLLTPFDGAEIDERAFAALIDWQLAEGVNGLATGTVAGEGPTLSPAERYRLCRIAVEGSARRVPVLAATGTNCTAATVELTRAARAAGASAAILVAPYYNKPSQEGIFRHVEAVARSVDLPLIVENAPSRTNIIIAPSTIERLAGLAAVVGFLDGTPDAGQASDNAEACGGRLARLAPREDAMLPGPGVYGCLSLAANLAPALCRAAWEDGIRLGIGGEGSPATRLRRLYRALDAEPEPAAVKYALSLICPELDPRPRLPLVPPCEAGRARLRVAVAGLCDAIAPAAPAFA